jgi:ankyrin repeat protein
MNAATRGHVEIVRLLLSREDIKTDIRAYDYSFSWTALVFAAHNGHEAVVRLLLERDDAGVDRALVFAARHGHEAVVRVLLEWNVGPEYSDALRYATEGKHETVVQLLREYQERLSGVIMLLNEGMYGADRALSLGTVI